MTSLGRWRSRITGFLLIAGLIVGAVASWLLWKITRSVIGGGPETVAIACLLVAGGGALLAKNHRSLRMFAIGLVAGVVLEAAYLLGPLKQILGDIKSP